MTRKVQFAQVDVFSPYPYRGNPVAVIFESEDLHDDQMQTIARWTNLSETTFLCAPTKPEADYRVRIFTPSGELPFAGHPTLGSAHAWLQASSRSPRESHNIVQECNAGLINVRRFSDHLAFAAPPMVRTGMLEPEILTSLIDGLGIECTAVTDHQWVDNGPGWAVIMVSSAEEVLALNPDFSLIPDAMVGAIGPYPPGSRYAFELRTFAPRLGVREDPVCGSMSASVAQWLSASELAPSHYRISQGKRLHRNGEIIVTTDTAGVTWIGGTTRTLFHGDACLP